MIAGERPGWTGEGSEREWRTRGGEAASQSEFERTTPPFLRPRDSSAETAEGTEVEIQLFRRETEAAGEVAHGFFESHERHAELLGFLGRQRPLLHPPN